MFLPRGGEFSPDLRRSFAQNGGGNLAECFRGNLSTLRRLIVPIYEKILPRLLANFFHLLARTPPRQDESFLLLAEFAGKQLFRNSSYYRGGAAPAPFTPAPVMHSRARRELSSAAEFIVMQQVRCIRCAQPRVSSRGRARFSPMNFTLLINITFPRAGLMKIPRLTHPFSRPSSSSRRLVRREIRVEGTRAFLHSRA